MSILIARLFDRTGISAELRRTKSRLRKLRFQYRTGQFSGHPEDTLEYIDNLDLRVKELREDLKKDPAAVAKLRAAEARWEALRKEYREGRYTGHPEEKLIDIENAALTVRKLRAALDEAAVPRG